MIETLKKRLQQYCREEKIRIQNLSILLSLSGGVDSAVLASLLVELREKNGFNLHFVHFNHQIHDKAKEAESLCLKFARLKNIGITIQKFTFAKEENIESSAREKRYSALHKIADQLNSNFILTAHHLNDQIETLYMKKLDNSDWISQIGIREHFGKVRRPLLSVDKNTIIKTANQRGVKWIEDPTNKDISFRRNRVRHVCLPDIVKTSPVIIDKLLRTAEHNRLKFQNLLSEFSSREKELIKCKSADIILIFLDKIRHFSIEELKVFIYWCAKDNYLNIPNNKTRGLWREFKKFIIYSKTGAEFTIDLFTFLKNRDELIIIADYKTIFAKPKKIELTHNKKWLNSSFIVNSDNPLNYNKNKHVFSIPDIIYQDGLYIRPWKHGDKMISATSNNHILISDLFINNKLSKINKLTQPLIVDKTDRIVWVPGLAHSKNFMNNHTQKSKVIEWIQP